ncbi:MAG: phage tail protein [Lachnospiraceae bacterium]|nr:phage tail protein [Lachnospiraceae bacterium]
MIYRVTFDGINILGQTRDTVLIEPKVENELNDAGSFEFTLPPFHAFYNSPNILTSDVEVYEDNALIWFGRPLDVKKDFYNQKRIYCEGALAFFNDSIQRPAIYLQEETLLHDFFRSLISIHNAQVPENRQFTVGEITVTDKYVWRKTDYEKTLECLNRMCLDSDGGYFILRRVEGVNYIDWVAEMPEQGDQPVQFALNILDISQELNGEDICTCVLPLGGVPDGEENKLTIASVNDGSDILEDADGVALYGKVTKIMEWPNITDASELKAKAQEWLTSEQYDHLTLEVDAAELSYLRGIYSPFKVGQLVHVTSTPHLINKDLPITKISLDLTSAKKQITIGTPPRKTLTEIVANGMSGSTGTLSTSGGSSGGGGATTLNGLTDVNLAGVANGQVLTYDITDRKWKNEDAGGGTEVEANPDGAATDTLIKIGVDGTVYGIESGNADVVHLTQAEYDALPDTKLTDDKIYMIEDANGDGSQFQPVIYSTEEREIGVTEEGKPLYQITVSISSMSFTTSAYSDYYASVNLNDYVSDIEQAWVDQNHSAYYMVSGRPRAFRRWTYDNNDNAPRFELYAETSRSNVAGLLTFTYTKTTDTPGSGTWTPSGVPAVHYSTEEQIIGTWMGKTLYQKTIYVASPITGGYYPHGAENVDFIKLSEVSIKRNGSWFAGNYYLDYNSDCFACLVDNTNLFVAFKMTSCTDLYATIQYTKSTD